MKKKFKNSAKLPYLIFIAVLSFLSCEKESTEKNTEAELIKIEFSFGEVELNTETKTGILRVPEGTDVSSMIATISISEGATVYPPTNVALDYSNPVTFTVV